MSTIVEMAEAHLLNVQREIQVLNERKVQIDQEIEKLTSYLNDGARELQETKSNAEAALVQVPEVPIQMFGPENMKQGPTNVTFT